MSPNEHFVLKALPGSGPGSGALATSLMLAGTSSRSTLKDGKETEWLLGALFHRAERPQPDKNQPAR